MKQSNISKELVESFGYEYNQLNEFNLGRAIGPANYVYLVWDAYSKIQQLPPTLSKDKWTELVTRIIADLITDVGVFWVGTIFGAIITGATGPGAIIGALAGGFAAQYYLGDKASDVTQKIVDALYPGSDTAEQPEDDDDEEEVTSSQWPTNDAEIRAFQQANGLVVDGLIGKNTYAALTSAGLTPPSGFTIVPDRVFSSNTETVAESIASLRDILAAIETK